jgi:LysR family transcriptional activator of dmlA
MRYLTRFRFGHNSAILQYIMSYMERIKTTDISQWEAFYWVATKQSFTQAARILRVNAPALSKKIARLEEQLKTRLFHRTTRRISTTQEGQLLLPQIEAMLEGLRHIESQFEPVEELSGLIRVACLPALAQRHLAATLVRFQKEFPLVRFDLHLSDQILDLVDAQIDVAIRVQEPTGAQFIFRKLIPNRLIFCGAPEYFRANGLPRRIEDLSRHRLFLLPAYERCRFINRDLSLREVRGTSSISCESGPMMTSLALEGAGIVVRSWWDVAPLIQAGRLQQVLSSAQLEPLADVYAVTTQRRLLPTRIKKFIEFLQADSKKWV